MNAKRRIGGKRQGWIVLAVLVLILATALYLLLMQRSFTLKNIVVTRLGDTASTHVISDEDIIRMADLNFDESMGQTDEAAIRARIGQSGYLSLDSIRFLDSHTLELRVNVRVPRAVIQSGGNSVLIDTDGCVMDQLDTMPTYSVVYVTGFPVLSINIGKKLESARPGQADAMLTVVNALFDAQMTERYSELNVEDADNMYLVTRSGIFVQIGSATGIADKLFRAEAALTDLAGRGEGRGKLDVSGTKDASWKPEAALNATATPRPGY